MEEYTQITLDQWMQWKEDIRRKLEETAGNFVYIGYRLKQIRDSGMYDGAADIFEFAEREYGLGKSTVSRFIAINGKYSEGGNSLELREEFRNFSSSKLAEMLTLTDAECQLITEKTTIKEIRELKSFSRQQDAGEPAAGTDVLSPLANCIVDFFRGKKEVLNEVMGYLRADKPGSGYREAAARINPAGQSSHRKGIVFLFLYDWVTGIKYKMLMQQDPVSMTWPEFLNEIYKVYADYDPDDTWTDFYNKKEEKTESGGAGTGYVQEESECGVEESVATSQQDDREDAVEENEKGVTALSGLSGAYAQADMGMQSSETEKDASSEKPGSNGSDEEVDGKKREDSATEEDTSLNGGTGDLEGQMDITQYEGCTPGQQAGSSEAEYAYIEALREILDNIFEQTEQRQYSCAEELLEAARGTINKIREVMRAGM